MKQFNLHRLLCQILTDHLCETKKLPETPRSLLKTSLTTTGFNLISFGKAAITSD